MAKTSSLISTISYNSFDFLLNKLDLLIYLKEISYYEFIHHYPDNDDKKEHFHVIIFPNNSQDLSKLQDYFIEPCNLKISNKRYKIKKIDFKVLFYRYHNRQFYVNHFKPLSVMPFWKTNKYGDWYWYGIHDSDYLRSKLLTRKCFYSDLDIVSSDFSYHNFLLTQHPKYLYCKMGDSALVNYCNDCVNKNVSLSSILSSGLVPLPKTQQFVVLYNVLRESFVTSGRREVIDNYLKNKEHKKKVDQLFMNLNFTEVNNSDLPFDSSVSENYEKDLLFD